MLTHSYLHIHIWPIKLSNTPKHREHFLKMRIQWNLFAWSSWSSQTVGYRCASLPADTLTHIHRHTCQDIAQQRNTRNKSTKVQKKGNELNLHMLNTGSFSMCHNTHTHTHTTLGPLCNLLLGASMKWAINSAIATVVRLCKVWMWMLQRRVRKLLCSVRWYMGAYEERGNERAQDLW